MTANALNIAAPNAAALNAGGKPGVSALVAAGAAGKASGPLAGFEALLVALFPQADPTAAAPTPGAQASPAAGLVAAADPLTQDAAKDAATGKDGKDGKDEAGPDLDATAIVAAAEPDAALAACLITIPAPAPGLNPKAPQGEAIEGGPLSGRLRSPNPFSAGHASAAQAGKHELAADVADAATDAADTDAAAQATADAHRPSTTKTPDAAKTPPAWGRDKLPGAHAAPALANANPNARLAEKAEPAPEAPPVSAPPPADPPAPASPPVTAEGEVQAESQVQAQTEPPPPVRTGKTSKTERAKVASETAEVAETKGPAAAAKPATSHAVPASAKAASADAEAASGRDEAAPAKPDQPEATFTAETRATNPSVAAAVHTAHAVRGSPETVANLAAQILKKIEGQSTRFDLELDPAGLGKVNVRLEIGAHGALTAAMSFDNPQAAAELRGRASELQRALEQAGFNLTGGLSFDVAGDRGQQQHGHAWQDQGEAAGHAFRGQAFRAALDTAGDAADAATSGALRLRRGVTAGLDVRI